jgi:hypothetical protein
MSDLWDELWQPFESDITGALGYLGKFLSGGFSDDLGDQSGQGDSPFTGENGGIDSFTGGWTADPFTTEADAVTNASNGEVVNPFAPGPIDTSLMVASTGTMPNLDVDESGVVKLTPLTPDNFSYDFTSHTPSSSPASPTATAPAPAPSTVSTVTPPVASDYDPAADRGDLPAIFVPPSYPPIDTWPTAPLGAPSVSVGSPTIAPQPFSQPSAPLSSSPATDFGRTWFGDLTQTEWAIPAPDPRLIQPITHYDTGNQPLNFVLNKMVLPWRNLLASFENVAIVPILGLSDLDRDLKQNPSFGTTYQAAQDYLPLDRAMGLAMEIGPALDYAATWISTNPSLGALATAPAYWFTGAGGVGGSIPPFGPELGTLGLGPELPSSLPPASTSTEASALFQARDEAAETARKIVEQEMRDGRFSAATSPGDLQRQVQRRFGTWLDVLAKTNVRQAVAEVRLPNTFVTSPTVGISRGYLGDWISAPDVWDTATGRAWDFMGASESEFFKHEDLYLESTAFGRLDPGGTTITELFPLFHEGF